MEPKKLRSCLGTRLPARDVVTQTACPVWWHTRALTTAIMIMELLAPFRGEMPARSAIAAVDRMRRPGCESVLAGTGNMACGTCRICDVQYLTAPALSRRTDGFASRSTTSRGWSPAGGSDRPDVSAAHSRSRISQ